MTTIPAENLLVSRAGLLAGPGMNVQTQGPTHAGAPTNPEEQKNPQPTKILQVEAMLFWGYFLKSWCCSNKTLVWQPSASFLLPVKHSHF